VDVAAGRLTVAPAGSAVGVPWLARLVSALVAGKLVLLFVLAWNSRFVMDEFQQLGFAKYFPGDFFATIWPAKAIGYAVFYKAAHLVGWDAVSILLAGRMQGAILACATLTLLYLCARALGDDRLRALLVLLVLLCFSNFMERIFRTIAEPLAVFFAVASLLVVLRAAERGPRSVMLAGALGGLAFLATQKAIYHNLALGLALVGTAAYAHNYLAGLRRGAWLVLGWTMPVIAYCLIFGGTDPVPIARHLFLGPVEVATQGGNVYTGLRQFVVQTLLRNALLYSFCFAGMALALARFGALDERRRIALLFTIVIAGLVFSHNQPWPYVFIMALPFMALWAPLAFDRLASRDRYRRLTVIATVAAVVLSFGRNVAYLAIDNASQLELVGRAEALVGPDEHYFDGVSMLPNRREPSILWLDRLHIVRTLEDGDHSEAYRVFSASPPKLILWSNRMDGILPVVAPLLRERYVAVGPNLRMVGRQMLAGRSETFDVPFTGLYGLYGETGEPLAGQVEVNGKLLTSPLRLAAGKHSVTLRSGPVTALLLPVGSYRGALKAGRDNDQLFARVYD
jgi:hypothetical protein